VPSWFAGQLTAEDGFLFMMDLKGELAERVQMTTDGHGAYRASIISRSATIDWAVLQKHYGADPAAERRYSPAVCAACDINVNAIST
jgi:hypothetical protein